MTTKPTVYVPVRLAILGVFNHKRTCRADLASGHRPYVANQRFAATSRLVREIV